MNNQELAKVLRDAGDWLDQHQHMKNYLWDDREHPTMACARGVLQIVTGLAGENLTANRFQATELMYRAEEVLAGRLTSNPFGDYDPGDIIVFWNNHPERTAEEVIKKFYAVADEIETV